LSIQSGKINSQTRLISQNGNLLSAQRADEGHFRPDFQVLPNATGSKGLLNLPQFNHRGRALAGGKVKPKALFACRGVASSLIRESSVGAVKRRMLAPNKEHPKKGRAAKRKCQTR
jgi:hypothetical protein